jgi:hypothetical protein
MDPGLTQLLTEISTRKCFWGAERDRCVKLTTPPPYLSLLSRKCGPRHFTTLRTPRPFTRIAFLNCWAYVRDPFSFLDAPPATACSPTVTYRGRPRSRFRCSGTSAKVQCNFQNTVYCLHKPVRPRIHLLT